jgi:hypothetical protein
MYKVRPGLPIAGDEPRASSKHLKPVKTATRPRSLFQILAIKIMKRVHNIALRVAYGLALSATLEAGASTNNAYASIAARNVFGLRPPETSAPVEAPEPVDIITPNGIAAISGQKWALFKALTVGAGSQEKSYTLHEGQSQDGIKVLKIDEKTGFVTFNNHGEIQGIPLAVVLDPNFTGHIFIGSHLRHYENATK